MREMGWVGVAIIAAAAVLCGAAVWFAYREAKYVSEHGCQPRCAVSAVSLITDLALCVALGTQLMAARDLRRRLAELERKFSRLLVIELETEREKAPKAKGDA